MVLLLTGKFRNDWTIQTWENRKTGFWDRIRPDFRPQFSGWRSVDGSKPLKLRCVRNFWTFRKSKRISISFTTYRDKLHRKKVLFSQIRHFSVHNSGTRFFPDMRFSAKWAHYYPLAMSRKPRKTNEPILTKITKSTILGQFGPVFPNFLKTGFFLGKPISPIFTPYNPPTWCTISKKTNDGNHLTFGGRTN